MRHLISENWKNNIIDKIVTKKDIDITTGITVMKKWLVITLTEYNIPFKIHNLGCGVTKITTITDTCPCCKKPL